jgi:hypothetical protein
MICALEVVRCKNCGREAQFICPVHGTNTEIYVARDGTGVYCVQVIENTTDTCLMRLIAVCATCDN